MRRLNDKGVALTVVIVIVIVMALISGYVTVLSYNQVKLANTAGGRRAKVYYRAQAGVVDANWRIRTNYVTGLTPIPGILGFRDASWNPNPYQIDVDGDSVMDCTVDINLPDGGGKRPVLSTGLDV